MFDISGFWLGIIGYVCILLFDLNSVSHNNDRMETLYAVGGGFIGLGLLGEISSTKSALPGALRIVFGILAGVFFILLTYAAFFAGKRSNWKPKDRGEKWWQKELAYTGVYALCRHPSVWFNVLMCVCLSLSAGLSWYTTVIYSLLGFLLAVYEDINVFPEVIKDYNFYKTKTPFLIPNKISLANYRILRKKKK